MNQMIYHNREAHSWLEAFPVGNGRLGAMMFGGQIRDRVVLNENSMWSGSVQDNNRKNAHLQLNKIRELLFQDQNDEAQRVFEQSFTCDGPGSGRATAAELPYGCYQVLGNLELYYHQSVGAPTRELLCMSGSGQCEDSTEYRRALHLDSAVADASYQIMGRHFLRECFASRVRDVIVYRAWSDEPHYMDINIQLNRPERFETRAEGPDTLIMTGALPDGKGSDGIQYACMVKAIQKGGRVYTQGNVLCARGADEVILLIGGATTMKSFAGRNLDDALQAVREDVGKAEEVPYEELKREHAKAHAAWYNRAELTLTEEEDLRPLDQRLASFRAGDKNLSLYELMFHYGRYLMIASTREDSLPPNAQGIWSDEIQSPWNSDWHLDAQQMNSWGTEITNMSALHVPYLRLIGSLVAPGRVTARDYYGVNGWVAHVITNPWGYTAPGEDAFWGATTTGSAWLCHHLWEHYLYTLDQAYLAWAYPVMAECARFYLEMLVEDPQSGYLVTGPANSPENSFRMDNGSVVQLCLAPTYDMQLLRYLFDACVEAGTLLGDDEAFLQRLQAARQRLVPTTIAPDGRIREWMKDYTEALPHHRHVSHLWGAYPGNEITPEDTPALAQAAYQTLLARGNSSAGWANMTRMGVYARLQKPEDALHLLDFQIQYNCFPNMLARTYHAPEEKEVPAMPPPDKYDYPMQIDCPLAVTGCMAELLMQSHRTVLRNGKRLRVIHLLPALPQEWKNGSVRGLCARGGYELSIAWDASRLARAEMTSRFGGDVLVVVNGVEKTLCLAAGETALLTAEDFPLS